MSDLWKKTQKKKQKQLCIFLTFSSLQFFHLILGWTQFSKIGFTLAFLSAFFSPSHFEFQDEKLISMNSSTIDLISSPIFFYFLAALPPYLLPVAITIFNLVTALCCKKKIYHNHIDFFSRNIEVYIFSKVNNQTHIFDFLIYSSWSKPTKDELFDTRIQQNYHQWYTKTLMYNTNKG